MNQRVGSALSLHPIAALATGEVLGELLEAVGYAPSVVILFVSNKHRESFQEIVNATKAILAPQCMIGSLSNEVLAGSYETDDEPALVGWAADVGRVTSYGPSIGDFPTSPDRPLLVLASSADDAEQLLNHCTPGSGPLIGGVPGSSGRLGTRLMINGDVVNAGVVGISFADAHLEPIVSSGSEAVGEPFTVTKSERSVVYELAFQTALDRLNGVLGALPEDDRLRARQGIHVGVEAGVGTAQRSHVVREVLGADRTNGALSLDAKVSVGDTIQFHLRDQISALSDLHRQLQDCSSSVYDGALVFTDRTRGRQLFGDEENDASTLSGFTNTAAAGLFCSIEIGPIGPHQASTNSVQSYVHKRYVVGALLRAPTSS
jgi:small ligand-binding sensory domain FIST